MASSAEKIVPPENGPTAALLSYLVPGLGQIYQGRVGKGVLFFVCVYTLFFYGQWLGSGTVAYDAEGHTYTVRSNVYLPDMDKLSNPWGLNPLFANLYNRPHFVGQFWVGIAAWPAIYQYYVHTPTTDQPNLDDVTPQDKNPPWRGFQRQPPERVLKALQREGDKTWDLAWVYTVIAGVLNVMVIYDAFAGPAFVVRPERRAEPSPSAAVPTPVAH